MKNPRRHLKKVAQTWQKVTPQWQKMVGKIRRRHTHLKRRIARHWRDLHIRTQPWRRAIQLGGVVLLVAVFVLTIVKVSNLSPSSRLIAQNWPSVVPISTAKLPRPAPPVVLPEQPNQPNQTDQPQPIQPIPGRDIYLTFDDGPSANVPELLDVLDQYGVKATFFVIGSTRTDLLKQIVAHGHAIGLHTFSHRYDAVYASDEAFWADVARDDDQVFQATGQHVKLLRFPGGSSNTVSANYSAGIMTRLTAETSQRGYAYFDWNCVTGDGGGALGVDAMVANAASCQQDQIMLLAHDRVPGTVAAMRQIIPLFQSHGYTFHVVTADSPGFHHQVAN
jgi:peptidoglycan/xylan/chitin deacetylase (PgdA/CDA1 family)